MKKRILIEVTVFLSLALIAVLIGYWMSGPLAYDEPNMLLPNGYQEMLREQIRSMHDRFWALFSLIAFSPLYFLVSLIRQVWLKFNSIAVNILLALSALLLLLVLYYLSSFEGLPGIGNPDGSWTIYPPLTAIPTEPVGGPLFDWIIPAEVVVSLVLMTTMIITMYKARKDKSDD